jgi:hypothetical protein
MITTTVISAQKVEVKTLVVSAQVRYWEDTEVNGKEDLDGSLIPCRNEKNWEPKIDLETGVITNWKIGTVASVHYKICDAGIYQLADITGKIIKEIDGYVPNILCPEGDGYGDYIIMKIDANGKIDKWNVDLSEFEGKQE